MRELDGPGHALEFRFALQLLDTVHDLVPSADAELQRLGRFIPAAGSMAVEGGIEDEAMHPLDFARNRAGRSASSSPTPRSRRNWIAS
ncbi:MAG: hypothetical protein ACRDUV_02160 [Pseudonocardiaceae bacterium]